MSELSTKVRNDFMLILTLMKSFVFDDDGVDVHENDFYDDLLRENINKWSKGWLTPASKVTNKLRVSIILMNKPVPERSLERDLDLGMIFNRKLCVICARKLVPVFHRFSYWKEFMIEGSWTSCRINLSEIADFCKTAATTSIRFRSVIFTDSEEIQVFFDLSEERDHKLGFCCINWASDKSRQP